MSRLLIHRSIPPLRLWLAAALFGVLSLTSRPAIADDAAPEFNPTSNLAGARWNYGWSPTRGGAFTLYANRFTDGFGIDVWNHVAHQGFVSHNPTAVPKNIGNNTIIPPFGLQLGPGISGQYSIVRWTAPTTGTYVVVARFTRRSTNLFSAADVAVLHAGAVVFSRWISNEASAVASMSASLPVTAGQTIDFAVGPADGSNANDVVGLEATVSLEPVISAGGPVIFFGGHRFVACHGDSAFESIAYDPLNQRLASRDIIRTRCGAPVFQGTEEHPGLTWDSRTASYWQVTNARIVRRWSPSGVFLGNVFTVPLTFNVPGWGLDTLESVKGIAVDSNFVYLVDAGDAGTQGQIRSNEWFKFTLTGTPVKSSKTTNFHANLDLNPDAIVDDIVYSPFSSPLYPGKLLIPLEHSGIQVIDTDGNFVAKFRWTDAGVPPGLKLNAFAGISIDPVNGHLYLVDNDGSTTQIWTRIPTASATYYAIGTGSNQPYLHFPNPGCNRPTWRAMPSTAGLLFGNAYRTANHSIYSIDFGSSDLWRYYPPSASGGRVTTTGGLSVWGVAYDTERDVLYGGLEAFGGIQLLAINPTTGTITSTPSMVGFGTRDLAFNPLDQKLYGVANVSGGPKLIRIDRDTGAGTVVGATADVVGMDWDPASARIIGFQQSVGPALAELRSINPASGANTSVTTLQRSTAWEGLAVVPVPSAPAVAVDPTVLPESSALRVVPNPSNGTARLTFSLPVESVVAAEVYDVAGRKLRTIGSGRFPAGAHSMQWDGRDDTGKTVSSGVYFVRLDHDGQTLVTRMVRLD